MRKRKTRKYPRKACVGCKEMFTAFRSHAKFCSARCRVRSHSRYRGQLVKAVPLRERPFQ